MKTPRQFGFTLVELLFTISIIAVLSAVVMTNMNSARKSGRDAQRKADLTNLKAAIELYRQKNGVYPAAGCGNVAPSFATEANCPTGYIVGLAPTFIARLPQDPKRVSKEGYAYITNNKNDTFKLMAMNTVEHEIVEAGTAMNSCDVGTTGICYPAATVCQSSDARFKYSYGVWGGFADGTSDADVKTKTAAVICR